MKGSLVRSSSGLLVALCLSACTMQQTHSVADQYQLSLAQAQLELGLGYLEQERLTLAQQHLEKAVAHAPSRHTIWRQAHYGLALGHLRSGDERRSEYHFLHALQGPKPYPEAENGLGVLRCRQGQVAEADDYFKRAIENPHYSTPEVALKNRSACRAEAL